MGLHEVYTSHTGNSVKVFSVAIIIAQIDMKYLMKVIPSVSSCW